MSALVLALMLMETGAQPAPGTGMSLLNQCRPSDARAVFCLGYLRGFVESRELGNLDAMETLTEIATASGLDAWKGIDGARQRQRNFCTPEGVTGEQLRLVVVKWLESQPARLHQSRSILVREALVDAFPCGSRDSPQK